jgi:hypothetical protein
LIAAGFYFAANFRRCCTNDFAWDFAINWTAARGMQTGLSIYDRESLQELGRSLIGPVMNETFRVQFDSYISPPSTAFILLPFTGWTFPTSLAIYRGASVAAFVLAVVITGLALPPQHRKAGWFLGLMGLFLADPVIISLQLGQVDAWITLALATSLWAASKDRWGWAGVGIGVAALLKISPVLLAVYCLLRGKWQTALVAALTALILLVLAAFAGSPSDLQRFIFIVLPSVSTASLHIQNQSLPGWLARIVSPETDLITFMTDIGAFRFLSLILTAVFLGLLWRQQRSKVLLPLEVALVIIIALLVGPLTWDHYLSWALVYVVLVSQREWWARETPRQRRRKVMLMLIAGGLLIVPMLYFGPAAIASSWVLRLATGTKTMALLIFLGVGIGLLARTDRQAAFGGVGQEAAIEYKI